MRRSTDFSSVVRRGARVRRGTIVVHQAAVVDQAADVDRARGLEAPGARRPIVGLVVGKSVGNSVMRHRVSRRLRAQLAVRLALLPESSGTVVRALPEAAAADSAQLGRDLDSAITRLAGAVPRVRR